MAKDYYKILGVDKKATDDEIKKAYHKLAIKWHPDKHTNDSEEDKKKAEAMFKDIAEAYEVLSNPTEREKYDNPHSNFTFNSSFNPFDLFNSMRGGGMGDIFSSFFGGNTRKNHEENGKDLSVVLRLTLEELYTGTVKKIKFTNEEICSECNGSGLSPNGIKITCKECGGIGYKNYVSSGFQQISSCPSCGGSGVKIENPCKKCNGSGLEKKTKEVEINIPKGCLNGMEFIVKGEGSQTKSSNGKFGDLHVHIHELSHPIFERDGNNLYTVIDVPILTAITGGEHIISTIDGKKIKIKIPKLCEYETNLRLVGKGMPEYNSNKYGNLFCVIKYKLPNKISKEEMNLLNELKEHENFQ